MNGIEDKDLQAELDALDSEPAAAPQGDPGALGQPEVTPPAPVEGEDEAGQNDTEVADDALGTEDGEAEGGDPPADTPAPPAPASPTPPDELGQLREQMTQMQQMFAQMMGQPQPYQPQPQPYQFQQPWQPGVTPHPQQYPPQQTQQAPQQFQSQQLYPAPSPQPQLFLSADELQQVFSGDITPLNTALARAQSAAVQESQRQMAAMIPQQIKLYSDINDTWRVFLGRNKDLAPFKEFVAFEVSRVQTENPGMDMAKVLDRAEKSVRQRLKLTAPAPGLAPTTPAKAKAPQRPALARAGGQRTPAAAPPVDPLQRELDEL